jgi:3-hydroxy-9,10-secoandrosta-1,3,5(10)-triene-9,17-dione monooxygenase reductase component
MKDAPETAADFDIARYRQVMGHFTTGVVIVAAVDDGEPVGLTAQTFTPLSIDPPLVTVFLQKSSSSWPHIESAGAFCVNILTIDQQVLSNSFAVSGADKFAGVGWAPSPATGSPILDGVLAWVDCRIEDKYEGGDHWIVVARVLQMDLVVESGAPLLFFRAGYGRFEA